MAAPTIETPGARVYMHYDAVPPHPGAEWTRLVCLSDTHSRTHWDVPPGDVLIHAGDLTRRGWLEQLKDTLKWIAGMPHPIKMCAVCTRTMSPDADGRKSDCRQSRCAVCRGLALLGAHVRLKQACLDPNMLAKMMSKNHKAATNL